MRKKILLVTALIMTLILSSCSVSIGGSGSQETPQTSQAQSFEITDISTNETFEATYSGNYQLKQETNSIYAFSLWDGSSDVLYIGFASPDLTIEAVTAEFQSYGDQAKILESSADTIAGYGISSGEYKKFQQLTDKTIIAFVGTQNPEKAHEATKGFSFKLKNSGSETQPVQPIEPSDPGTGSYSADFAEVEQKLAIPSGYTPGSPDEDIMSWYKGTDNIILSKIKTLEASYYQEEYPDGEFMNHGYVFTRYPGTESERFCYVMASGNNTIMVESTSKDDLLATIKNL